jgi:hypothetical protein
LKVLVFLLLCFIKGHVEMIPSDKIRVNKSVVQIGKKNSSGARGVENSLDKGRVVGLGGGGLQMKSDKIGLFSLRQTYGKFYRNSSVFGSQIPQIEPTNRQTDKPTNRQATQTFRNKIN